MSATQHVLLVDDHEPWRRQVRLILQQSRRWRVITEASDGLSAVQTALALNPACILLDVQLPALNGLEAAQRIRAANPNAKILFLTLHRSLDVVEAALAAGARGYVLKSDCGELLPAMEAIVAGKCYISAGLTLRNREDISTHEVGLYTEDEFLIDAYARAGTAALQAGKSFVFVAAESRRNELSRRLQARGIDVDRVIRAGRYLVLDTAETLSDFLLDGSPDPERFWRAGTALFMRAAKASDARSGVFACGDGAATLLQDGRVEAAIRFEQLWDDLAKSYNIDIFCGYRVTALHDAESGAFRQICNAHSAVHSR